MSLRPEERELVIGMNDADDYIYVDAAKYGYSKFINICDTAVAEGKGIVIAEDEDHKSYRLLKSEFNIGIHTKKKLTDEQREAAATRLKESRNKKAED